MGRLAELSLESRTNRLPLSFAGLVLRISPRNHAFVDGNKRTAFIAAYTFLAMNGIVIHASQERVTEAMEALANSMGQPRRAQARFSDWLSSVSEAAAQERP